MRTNGVVEENIFKNYSEQYGTHFLCHLIEQKKDARTWEVSELRKASILPIGSSSLEVSYLVFNNYIFHGHTTCPW
jgi:hypothetical protein